MKINEFVVGSRKQLTEDIITFGGKLYPKFGQVVILAGGAGSGKGFVKDNLLGIEGIVFDVDRLKELLVASMRFNAKVKEEFGVDLKQIDFKNTEDVSTLHEIVSILNIPDKKTEAVIRSVLVADPSRKPNLIFDVTLKDLTKFFNIIRQVQQMGYVKKNVSLVWILNELEIALQQNAKRARTVAPEILISTHKGASYTMTEILSMGEDLSQYMDGDIWLVFNKAKVDSDVERSEAGGMYIKSANYVQLKKQSGQVVDISKLTADVVSKIKKYVPNPEVWDAATK